MVTNLLVQFHDYDSQVSRPANTVSIENFRLSDVVDTGEWLFGVVDEGR